jgi:hypothetical protein
MMMMMKKGPTAIIVTFSHYDSDLDASYQPLSHVDLSPSKR